MSWNVTNGVKFDSKHSYKNWGLYLRERPEIEPPEPKTTYIGVPCMDGEVDLTTSLTDGDVKYEMRKVKFRFSIFGNRENWYNIFSEVQNYLHGKKVKIIIDEDPSYYYLGRVSVDSFDSNKYKGYITISGYVEPYKYELTSSLENWLWDPFNFETDYVRDYKNLSINGTYTLVISGNRKWVVPTITVSGSSAGITFTVTRGQGGSATKTLDNGTHKDYDLRLTSGTNTVEMVGTGTVSIDYRGGSL